MLIVLIVMKIVFLCKGKIRMIVNLLNIFCMFSMFCLLKEFNEKLNLYEYYGL